MMEGQLHGTADDPPAPAVTLSLLGKAAELPLQGSQITQQDVALNSDARLKIDVRRTRVGAAALSLQGEVLSQGKLAVSLERFDVPGVCRRGYRCHGGGLRLDVHSAVHSAAGPFLKRWAILKRTLLDRRGRWRTIHEARRWPESRRRS